MNNRIERKIQKMLKVEKKPSEVFDELTLYLFRKKITDEERVSIIQFAVNAGLDQQLLSVFVDLFHEKQVVPWNLFMDLIERQKLKPTKHVIESVIKGVRRQKREEDLSLTDKWDKHDGRFLEIRERITKKRHEEFSERKGVLLDKLSFYRAQRMIHEEEKLLKIMRRMFPADQQIRNEFENFKEVQAHEIISRNQEKGRETKTDYGVLPTPLTKDEKKFVLNLKGFILDIVKKEKHTAYNFAILFRFIGEPRLGLEILRYVPVSASADWLIIDLLIEDGQYIQCLDKVHEVELKYSMDPETTFAATYARARALNHLGQSGKAIDLLKSIIEVRPDYRSAHSLLTEWSEQWAL